MGRNKEKLVAMFVDLRAAFDSVDRGVLIEAMRERGIREGLIMRTEEILGETRSRIRVGGSIGESKGSKAGMPIKPTAFQYSVSGFRGGDGEG